VSDDIVERLRREIPCWCDSTPTRNEVRETCWEAAAEIERWRNIADGLYQWAIGILGDHMTIEPVKQYEKAVRGE
jgi:hypothetical protein